MTVHGSILELIGNTPLLRVNRFDTGPCELYLKLENTNPGGSIKDRIGLSMIEAAERAGKIQPGATLVEGTAGNTGIGLALVAQAKGYRLILVVPDKMSREKIFNLKAMGAEVVLTRSDVAKGHPQYYQDLAERIARETPGAYFINQFGNPDNPRAHVESTGPEILEQMGGRVDALVFGCGSSGTMTGLSRYFAEHSPDTELVLADPVGSILTQYINEGVLSTKSGTWLVEGIGEDFVPDILELSLVDKAYDKALVGWMWTLGVVTEIVVFMLMPRITQRFSLRAILLFSFVCAVLRFVMIGWGAGSLVVLLAAQLLHGATFGAYHAAAIAVVNQWFPGRLQSRGQALYGSLSFGAGGMLGGLLSGYTWETIGAAWTYTIGSGFALAGLVWLFLGWRGAHDVPAQAPDPSARGG